MRKIDPRQLQGLCGSAVVRVCVGWPGLAVPPCCRGGHFWGNNRGQAHPRIRRCCHQPHNERGCVCCLVYEGFWKLEFSLDYIGREAQGCTCSTEGVNGTFFGLPQPSGLAVAAFLSPAATVAAL